MSTCFGMATAYKGGKWTYRIVLIKLSSKAQFEKYF